jgi:hypothetical protein
MVFFRVIFVLIALLIGLFIYDFFIDKLGIIKGSFLGFFVNLIFFWFSFYKIYYFFRKRVKLSDYRRFKKYFKKSVQKLESPKNRLKKHWLDEDFNSLIKKCKEEDAELYMIANECWINYNMTIDELKDRINTALLLWDYLNNLEKKSKG